MAGGFQKRTREFSLIESFYLIYISKFHDNVAELREVGPPIRCFWLSRENGVFANFKSGLANSGK